MRLSPNPDADLRTVVDLMRELSRQTDPQSAATLYGNGLRKLNMVPHDLYVSISRRDLSFPQYRVTRATSWNKNLDPWKQRDLLPLLSGGLLAEILYQNEPVILRDLPARLRRDDPAYEYLKDIQLLVALPHFDNGEAINYGLLLNRTADTFPFDDLPIMIWQANLWGRATLNLVNRQKLDEAYRSLDRELRVVGEIQRSLLPRSLPEIPGVDMAVHYQTSQRAGGDYYDFFPLPEGKWGIFVADVSGHGTPAAVMMAVTHAIAHSRPGHPMPPRDVLCDLNRQLARLYTTNNGTFVTAFYGVLDPASRTLTYVCAGHPSPRLIRGGVSVAVCAVSGYPLGIVPDETYEERTIELQPNDRLVLYTDGIPEAFNPSGELFGVSRLDAGAAGPAQAAGSIVKRVLDDLSAFTAEGALTDDRTLLAMLFA